MRQTFKKLTNNRKYIILLSSLLISPISAYAYLDPGTGSMLIQLFIGLTAGLILTAKQFWRKLFNSVGLFKKK